MQAKPNFLISHISDGNMQFTGGETSLINRNNYFLSQNIDQATVVSGQLVNGANIALVTKADGGSKIMSTDGLITTDPTIWLSITVADCLAVILRGNGVIALLHCGWRGLNLEIIKKAMNIFRNELHIDSEISAYIGPGIDVEHYEVGEDVAQYFYGNSNSISKQSRKLFLDLKVVAREQLKRQGIYLIDDSSECTFCSSNKYFSARRDRVSPTEAMMVLAKL